ncbi:MAG: Hsp33 family molecular chaperone HslO [Spirochaetia bacterium]
MSDRAALQLLSVAADGMDIFLLAGGSYRGGMLHGTRLVNQMRANHRLGIMETLILGHAYLAAGLMTSLVKGNDRIRLDISCDGPVGGISVDSNARGEIRGYLRNSRIRIDTPLDSFDTAPFIGSGTLTVTRTIEMAKRPVSGHVRMEHGTLAEDLPNYFLVSEQKPTAVSLSIQFDREGVVTGAGALFIQALPESHHSVAADLDQAVRALPSLGSMFAEGDTPAHAIKTLLSEFDPEIIGSRTAELSCPCSRQRFGRYLHSLPTSELEDILTNGPLPVNVTCHSCNSTYIYGREEIELLATR